MSQATDRPIDDSQFLSQCRWEAFRGPGPGGQKRNKTSSMVRVVHEPTGLSAIAGESRSQSRNRAAALERLRHRLAVELRQDIDPDHFVRPPWFARLLGPSGRLKVAPRSEDYLPTVALVLDLFAAVGCSAADAARLLGITTAALTGFLRRDEKLWGKVNQMRVAAGLRSLIG